MVRYLVILLLPFALPASAGTPAGQWIPPGGDAVIQIVVGETAQVTLLRTLAASQIDNNNPDKALRQRPLAGILIGSGFVRSAREEAWVDGKLYDPASGRTYKAQMRLIDDHHLELRGYVGVVALGRSEIWTRREQFEQQMLRMLDLECAQ